MEDKLMDENTEDYLEILYWEFDTERKKGSFSERDLFKAKMRGLIRTIQNTRATDPLLEKMAEALNYLTFDCFEFFNTKAPSIETYNKAFKVLQEYKEKSNG